MAKFVTETPKSFYANIRSKAKTKDTVGHLTDENGKLGKEEIYMCDVLNKFFSSVCPRGTGSYITGSTRFLAER